MQPMPLGRFLHVTNKCPVLDAGVPAMPDTRMDTSPFNATKDGGRLAIRLAPRASQNRINDVYIDTLGRAYLQVSINAPPVDGAANKAVIKFLAKELGLRKAQVEIISGAKSRLKILDLTGSPDALECIIKHLLHAET